MWHRSNGKKLTALVSILFAGHSWYHGTIEKGQGYTGAFEGTRKSGNHWMSRDSWRMMWNRKPILAKYWENWGRTRTLQCRKKQSWLSKSGRMMCKVPATTRRQSLLLPNLQKSVRTFFHCCPLPIGQNWFDCKASPPPLARKESTSSEPSTPRTIKSDEVTFDSTGNGPRDKTIELLYSAVALGSYAGKRV